MIHPKVYLTLDADEAKALRQILKERVAFCLKEEKVISRQAATHGQAAHMYTQTYYATRTIKARALAELVSAEIKRAERLARQEKALRHKPQATELENYVETMFDGVKDIAYSGNEIIGPKQEV